MQKIGDMQIDCAGRPLDLTKPQVMGILNVTPDSFSDGGDFFSLDTALDHAHDMVAAGAAIIDVGGESTRPGANPVTADEELRRVIPVVEALHRELEVPVSIDTRKAIVMREAVAAGAGMINDVSALMGPGALNVAHDCDVPVCLMHMRGEPGTMQSEIHYSDVADEVISFLVSRITDCLAVGMAPDQLLLDPGFGFGKKLEHNVHLLNALPNLASLGYPLVVGLSRKSLIGDVLGLGIDQRLPASIALATLATWQGARLIRAHDVRATFEAIRVCHRVRT